MVEEEGSAGGECQKHNHGKIMNCGQKLKNNKIQIHILGHHGIFRSLNNIHISMIKLLLLTELQQLLSKYRYVNVKRFIFAVIKTTAYCY